jgi:signal transduction histidine kinase/CheY-like chemotaxis protein
MKNKKNNSEKKLNFGELAEIKSAFSCFENFLKVFHTLKKDLFIWVYELEKRKSIFRYSENLPLILNLNVSEKSVLDKGLNNFIHEEDINDYQSRIDNLLNQAELNNLEQEYRLKTIDGSILYFQEKVVKYLNKDKTILIGFANDVSSYKKTFSILTERIGNQKEQINSRDKFLSILSHDLRAPFTSIIGFTEILMEDDTLSDKERNEFLSLIKDSATNQLQFVNYILDWSNLKLGRIQLNLQKVPIANLIYNSISNLTGNSIRKNIEIKTRIDDSIYVKVDERLVLQAITNLLSNSIKFTPEGKRIYIYTNRFNKNFIELIIKDEGVGIPEEHKSKLFNVDNLFTQRGTKGEKGSGIGLSLVKEIIEKHGGQIWFFSKENEGTEFHFTLPLVENTILLIENDIEVSKLVLNSLNEHFWMFKTIWCENAYKALDSVFDNLPAMIIMNPKLEMMTGKELIKSMKKIYPNFDPPIILLVDDLTLVEEFEEFGIKNYILKPFEFHKLELMISNILCMRYN